MARTVQFPSKRVVWVTNCPIRAHGQAATNATARQVRGSFSERSVSSGIITGSFPQASMEKQAKHDCPLLASRVRGKQRGLYTIVTRNVSAMLYSVICKGLI